MGGGRGGTGHDKALIGVIVERTTAAQQNMSSMQEEALEEAWRTSQVGLFSTVHLYLRGNETKTPDNLAGRVLF